MPVWPVAIEARQGIERQEGGGRTGDIKGTPPLKEKRTGFINSG